MCNICTYRIVFELCLMEQKKKEEERRLRRKKKKKKEGEQNRNFHVWFSRICQKLSRVFRVELTLE